MVQQIGRADMHMHTNVSDGAADVQTLLARVSTLDLDVIAITDHDRLDATLWAYDHRDQYNFDVVPGLEVTSYEGHVLAWWVTTPIPPRLSLEETVQAIHEAGGVAILAHPFHVHVSETRRGFQRYWRNMGLIEQIGFDGVEVSNAGIILPGVNLIARRAVRSLAVAQVGNSDAHTLNGIGSSSTTFPGRTAQDLRQAIATCQTWANVGMWSVGAYISYAQGVMDGSIVYEPTYPDTQ
jgi:predicted metal-dependent phosphoesterase TrpH